MQLMSCKHSETLQRHWVQSPTNYYNVHRDQKSYHTNYGFIWDFWTCPILSCKNLLF